MTRNELAKAVQAAGIKTPKNAFFMKAEELEALLKKAAPKAKKVKTTVVAVKRGTILELAAKGLTRKQILAEMEKQGMPTSNGYLNSVSFHEKIKITSEREAKS